jgi:cytochrome c oxidase assembly protein subunit 11
MSQIGRSDPGDVNKEISSLASRQNRNLAFALLAFAALMVGMSFAAVPLYRMFCAATGFAGTPQRAAAASTKIAPETVTVRFDANVSPGLAWSFQPVQNELTLHVGENKLAFFRATNLSKEPLTGSAVFNVSPDLMGQYFTKVQCFCFTEQTLKPGETIEMPVSFFIDPEILKDRDARTVRDMTLSYTFFKVQKPGAAADASAPESRAAATLAKTQNPG